MRKFLLILSVLVALAAIALAVFIATFDADRYRPLLTAKLQQSLGRPVSMERIALGWRGGLALQCRGLTIAERSESGGEPLLHVESATALVRLAPLLHKQIQVASVILTRPRIHVVRDAQGHINLTGLAVAGAPAAAPAQAVRVGETNVSLSIGSFRINDGTLHWTNAMTNPPTELWVKALDATVTHIVPGQPMGLDVTAAVAGDAPNLHVSGHLTPPSATGAGSVEQASVSIDRLPLERVLPVAGPSEPQLRGVLTTTLQGRTDTLDPARLTHALSGRGTLKLTDCVLVNLNVLREVFGRLSVIPGLMQTLEERLPPEYQAKLAAKDTVLLPIDASMEVEDGIMRFENLEIRSDTFRVSGGGRVGLDGQIMIRSTLSIEPVLSSAIIRSVNELQALATKEGELEIPLTIQGQASQLAVLPDLHYVASKVIVTKAVDVLGRFLEKKNPGSSDDTSQSSDHSSGSDLLGQFLERAIQRHAPSQSTPQ